jgi:hypothetical protein
MQHDPRYTGADRIVSMYIEIILRRRLAVLLYIVVSCSSALHHHVVNEVTAAINATFHVTHHRNYIQSSDMKSTRSEMPLHLHIHILVVNKRSLRSSIDRDPLLVTSATLVLSRGHTHHSNAAIDLK